MLIVENPFVEAKHSILTLRRRMSKQRILLTTVMLLAAGATWTACDEKLSTLAGPTPNLAPTFATIQSEIFEKTDSAGRPACINCHTAVGRNPAGGANFTHDLAYDNLVNVPVRGKAGEIRVIPGDPDNSYLIKKLEGNSSIVGQRMPIGGKYLTDGQILIVRRWIANGASR
jgi:hypothetical protein